MGVRAQERQRASTGCTTWPPRRASKRCCGTATTRVPTTPSTRSRTSSTRPTSTRKPSTSPSTRARAWATCTATRCSCRRCPRRSPIWAARSAGSTKSERAFRSRRQRPGDRRHRFHRQGRVRADQREIGHHCLGRLRSRRRDVPVLLAHDRLRHGRPLLQSARRRHRRHAQAGHLGRCRHAEVRAAFGRHAPRLRRGQLRLPARELGRQALQERGREHPVEERDEGVADAEGTPGPSTTRMASSR